MTRNRAVVNWAGVATAAVLLILESVDCRATSPPIIFEGFDLTLKASVTFEQMGSNLIVTLANTSTTDVLVPTNVLTAVFFTLAGDPALTRISAVVPAGSIVLFGTTDPGGGVGGEWAYRDDLRGAPGKADEGISTAGFGLFGPPNRFPGSNLQGPQNIAGLQYGITSAGDNPATGNSPVTGGDGALIRNSVVFTFGLPAGYRLMPSSISTVYFQYGTDTGTDPRLPGVLIPEPSTAILTIAGLLGTMALVRRRR